MFALPPRAELVTHLSRHLPVRPDVSDQLGYGWLATYAGQSIESFRSYARRCVAWRQREYMGSGSQEALRTSRAGFIGLHAESGFGVRAGSRIFVVVPKAFRLSAQGGPSSVLS